VLGAFSFSSFTIQPIRVKSAWWSGNQRRRKAQGELSNLLAFASTQFFNLSAFANRKSF
jgi:hypothetical protein